MIAKRWQCPTCPGMCLGMAEWTPCVDRMLFSQKKEEGADALEENPCHQRLPFDSLLLKALAGCSEGLVLPKCHLRNAPGRWEQKGPWCGKDQGTHRCACACRTNWRTDFQYGCWLPSSFQVPTGFSVAASVRVGNALGAGDIEQAKTSSAVALLITGA